MADFASDYALGEEFTDNERQTVRLAAAVNQGDILEVTGVHAASNNLLVRRHTGQNPARFVALHAGAADTYAVVLYRGTTKLTFGADVTPGASCTANANKIRDAAGNNPKCGYIISNGAADDDTGLVYFDGGAN